MAAAAARTLARAPGTSGSWSPAGVAVVPLCATRTAVVMPTRSGSGTTSPARLCRTRPLTLDAAPAPAAIILTPVQALGRAGEAADGGIPRCGRGRRRTAFSLNSEPEAGSPETTSPFASPRGLLPGGGRRREVQRDFLGKIRVRSRSGRSSATRRPGVHVEVKSAQQANRDCRRPVTRDTNHRDTETQRHTEKRQERREFSSKLYSLVFSVPLWLLFCVFLSFGILRCGGCSSVSAKTRSV